MKAFEDHGRFETVLIRIRGVEAFRSLVDPVLNFLVGAGSQSSYWMVFLIDIVEQVTGPRQLLDSSRPPSGHLSKYGSDIALPNKSRTFEETFSS